MPHASRGRATAAPPGRGVSPAADHEAGSVLSPPRPRPQHAPAPHLVALSLSEGLSVLIQMESCMESCMRDHTTRSFPQPHLVVDALGLDGLVPGGEEVHRLRGARGVRDVSREP
jgi:hypothetical protein